MPDNAEKSVTDALKAAVDRGELDADDLAWALERFGDGRRVQRADPQTRRPDILAAATRLFATHGYHVATLQNIADQLGLTRPAFYYYFKSKQSILEAICRDSIDEADDVISRAFEASYPSRAERLRQTLYAYAAHSAEAFSTAIMMRNFDEMSEEEKVALRLRRRQREQKLADLLSEGAAAGEFKVKEPLIAIFTIFEAIHAIHIWHDRSGRLSRLQASRIIVDQLVDGLV
ncbi:MAG: TetR/AcrR family transcriptional regulator [Rhizobiaceae bacterium]